MNILFTPFILLFNLFMDTSKSNLFMAIKYNNYRLVERFLKEGVHPDSIIYNTFSNKYLPAIICAMHLQRTKILEILVKYNVNIYIYDNIIINKVIANGYTDAIKIFIGSGLDVDLYIADRPLIVVAIASGQTDIVKLLLEKNCNVLLDTKGIAPAAPLECARLFLKNNIYTEAMEEIIPLLEDAEAKALAAAKIFCFHLL